jgi:hypothetical protein
MRKAPLKKGPRVVVVVVVGRGWDDLEARKPKRQALRALWWLVTLVAGAWLSAYFGGWF